jgi:hypothetical protein
MTRKKKTRSLSRIHKVKTGNISKLKREAGNDRQSSKRLKGRRTLSAYEKFLAENPEAKAKAVQEQQSQTESQPTQPPTETVKKVKEKGLLDQLDSKDFNDIY